VPLHLADFRLVDFVEECCLDSRLGLGCT
jgi:hypothetical protein